MKLRFRDTFLKPGDNLYEVFKLTKIITSYSAKGFRNIS